MTASRALLRVIASAILLVNIVAPTSASPSITIGESPRATRVPAWDASGLGQLPWQGVSCAHLTADGKLAAVGTMAPLGDPNVFLIGPDGQIIEQHAVGQRWIGEVAAFGSAPAVAAICTSPTGAAEDNPALFRFSGGSERGGALNDLRPIVFQYGEHSNHLAPAIAACGAKLATIRAEGVHWIDAGGSDVSGSVSRYGRHEARVISCAASTGGRLVVGWVVDDKGPEALRQNVGVMEEGKPLPLWARPADACRDVEAPPALAAGLYGPHTHIRDMPVWAPLSVAIDGEGKRVAAADYQGYERFVLPRTPDEALRPLRSLGIRFTPSRPTIHVYDEAGRAVRAFAADRFARGGWFDLAFTGAGDLLAYPHHWASRGLAARPCLPADDDAGTLYVLSCASGDVQPVHFPDAISDVAAAGPTTVVGCWDGRVYLLGPDHQPIASLPHGLDVGAPSLVRMSADGSRVLIATSAGVIHMLDAGGRELWKNDLARTATPGDKPWAKSDRTGSQIGPHVWRNNTGRAQSDLGNQIAIEAPDGLLLVDPNSGHSFEQNWAMMKAEGLDPMRVKYILPTHEHGDHAPGAYLWRVITGAKVIASPEMAYTLQHDLPYTSGYGFHPPVPIDILADHATDMDLCGLKVKALRLPGHTYGSMGCSFDIGGRRYVCLGDLIMPDGPLGYSGSVNFWAPDVLASLKKLDQLKPDYVLCGHGNGTPDHFIGAGISAGEATGWGKMTPPNPDPMFGFASRNYQVVGWLEDIYSAAFGDIDGDGLTDIAIVTPGDRCPELKIYLNKNGHFDSKPDKSIELPGMGPDARVRINHLTAGKAADFLVSTESDAILLLADSGATLAWQRAPIEGATRAATFAADRSLTPPQCVIGERFVQGCRLCALLPDGSLKTTEGPKLARSALELQLLDVNGDGRSDLVTAGGEIFLRGPDGKLPETATYTLERPYGDWTCLAVGDFNGDGKPDIAQVGMNGVHLATSVFYNTGDPRQPYHLKADAEIDLGVDLAPIRDGPTVADFNNDGIDDLILGHAQRQNIVIIPGSKTGLDRSRSIHLTVDYRLHYDTKLGVLNLDGKGNKAIADLGVSAVGAKGVYIQMPDGPSSAGPGVR